MNFALAFGRTLLWRPHRALGALYWYMTGRKVRARNRLRLAAAQSPHAYRKWIETVERLPERTSQLSLLIDSWTYRPRFTILVFDDPAAPAGATGASIQSVNDQLYDRLELFLARPDAATFPSGTGRVNLVHLQAPDLAKALQTAAERSTGDYLIALKAGDLLSPAALHRYGEALQTGCADILYGDEDSIDAKGLRSRPWFKPDWNEEMFLAQDYVSGACAIRMDSLRSALPITKDLSSIASYAVLLRIIAGGTAAVAHVPHIISHRRFDAGPDQYQQERITALSRQFAPSGMEVLPGPFGTTQIKWPLPSQLPLVSIIIPTRDKVKLLRKCVDGVLHETSYPNLELLIVDNGSIEPQTHAYLDDISANPRVRVFPYAAPYNYSAINNFAAAQAHGEYLCLLNNDTEVLEDGWLTQMMRQAIRPHVGAVGAKLLYEDRSIQHAGVIIGLGDAAGHAHRFLKEGQPGYFCQAHVPQYVSAVTAACLLVQTKKFEAVGGLDEAQLAVAFNDVDLCLKLERAGWRNVYTPHAALIHHESKSRGRDISPQHIDRYLKELKVLEERWSTKTYSDPLYNPNLSKITENFLIGL